MCACNGIKDYQKRRDAILNKEFASSDRNFVDSCKGFAERHLLDWVKVASKRQASKFRMRKGRVFKRI
jgi:hypothetical protein